MSKNIIITCGTSICNSDILEGDLLLAALDLDNNSNQFDDIYNFIQKKISEVEQKSLWAEINVLKKIWINQWDKVYFFFSETKWWELLKKIFEDTSLLQDELWDFEKEFYIIEGFNLQWNNFVKKWVTNFFEKLEEIREKTQYQDKIMCPVWWYKAIIPYASLYAMVNSWRIDYLYENQTTKLTLPSFPIDYNIDFVKDLKLIFSDDKDIKDIEEFKSQTSISTVDEIASIYSWLLEVEENMIWLSSIGKLFYNKFIELENTIIQLSTKANSQFSSSNWNVKKNFKRIFTRLKDSKYRDEKKHASIDKYIWYKMGNTSERVLYFEEDRDWKKYIKICEVVLHDEYERLWNNILNIDYKDFIDF